MTETLLPPLSSTAVRSLWAAHRCVPATYRPVEFYGWPSPLRVAAPAQDAFRVLALLLKVHGVRFTESAGGTYNCRKIAGSEAWSLHAYAVAVDINPSQNPRTPAQPPRTKLPAALIDAVESVYTVATGRRVFVWGGRWNSPDPMHFQIACGPDELEDGVTMAANHDTIEQLRSAHAFDPDWAEVSWQRYVEAGGTSVPHSSTWIAYRHDLGWFWHQFVRPLADKLDALEARIAELETRP